MEQKNSNYEYKVIAANIEGSLINMKRVKENNERQRKEWQEIFDKDSTDCKKIYLSSVIPANDRLKYQYLYLFFAERNNKKIQIFDSNDKKVKLYAKRIKAVLLYLQTVTLNKKNEKTAIKERYAIQSAIQEEVINYYKCLIEEKKCDRKMQQQFEKYVNFLKNIHDPEYENFVSKLADINKIDMEQQMLEDELQELIEFLKSQTLEINKSKWLELIQNNIISVLNDICPEYKKISDEKKGRQIA